jgi:energy-converting hydrogenase Eha subunit H
MIEQIIVIFAMILIFTIFICIVNTILQVSNTKNKIKEHFKNPNKK